MSLFMVNVAAVNPKREELVSEPVAAPGGHRFRPHRAAGTGAARNRHPAATGARLRPASLERGRRPVSYGILRSEGHETNDEIVFAGPGDLSLLGVRTLEGCGVTVDPIGQCFLPVPTLAARGRGRDAARPAIG